MGRPQSQYPVRMSDVARVAGLSTMTVSRVLNASANVQEETRQRVFKAIESLGYRRNELARSLRERRSRQIGVLLPNLHDTFFARCAHTINEVSRLLGYSIDIAATDQDPLIELDEASRMLRRSVDGLIVVPSGLEKVSALMNREFERIPIVAMDRPAKGSGRRFDTLVVENRKGAQLGTQHLIALGHQRIAYFTLEAPLYTLRLRIAGYVSAMNAAGLEPLVVQVPETIPDTTARLKEILKSYKPTAVFAANNVVSSQLLHSLYELSLHPPEKMAFVGFDDFEFASLLGSGITVISQPVELMARQAAELLLSKLSNTPQPEAEGRTITLPVRLIVRGSSGSGRNQHAALPSRATRSE